MSSIFDNQDKPFKPLGHDDEWLHQKLKEHRDADDKRDCFNTWTTPRESSEPREE